jgi:S1-C subfamily serine protease
MLREHRGISSAVVALVFVAGLLVGGMATAYVLYRQIGTLKSELSTIETQISTISGSQIVYNQTITLTPNVTDFSAIYNSVKDSVVLIYGTTSSGDVVQGSGFVYNYSGPMYVITNNHVVADTTSLSVTFFNGNAYAATVKGRDPYSDLAVVSVPSAPQDEFKPLDIVKSSSLQVGSTVIAVGNPYGLVNSMTTGIVSAVGRTITEDEYTGGFAIANIIQTSTPINPGNSGGPLLNSDAKVVGITAAIIENSQGLGFAIPSDTILKEIFSLVQFGHYDGHSYLGVRGTDMNYTLAQNLHVNVTYGWLIGEVVAGGPAEKAGVEANDIIVGINGTFVRDGDGMTSYVEANTLPGQTVVLTIIRGSDKLFLPVVLGTRPPPP